jgi:hypothetical protein
MCFGAHRAFQTRQRFMTASRQNVAATRSFGHQLDPAELFGLPSNREHASFDSDHIPFMFIATDEKPRTSRLATMLAVVVWYFLKWSVARCASSAAALS